MATPLEVFLQGRDQTKAAFRSLDTNLGKIRTGTSGLLAKWRDLTVVATGLTRVVRSVANTFGQTIGAAERQVNAEIKLAASLRGTEGALADNVARLKEFAAGRQAVTTFGDEVTLELAAIGGEFGLTVDQIEKAVVAVQDRSLALGRGPLELMRVIARFGGEVSDSLIDVGVVVDKTADRATEFNRAMDEMTSGLAELSGSLPTSALTKLGNTLGDVQEGFGKVIVSTGTFQVAVQIIEDLAERLTSALDNRETLEAITDAIDAFAKGILTTFDAIAGGLLRTIASIIDVIALLVETGQDWGLIETADDAAVALNNLEEEMRDLVASGVTAGEEFDSLSRQIAVGQERFERLAGATEISGQMFRDMANTLGDWTAAKIEAIDAAGLLIDAQEDLFEKLEKANAGIAAQRDELKATQDLMADLEIVENFAELLSQQGQGIGQALSIAIADSLDRDVGIKAAVDDLGKRLKFTFIDNFSEAALSPIQASFGALAVAAAQPFQIVGNIINKVLITPLTTILTNAIAAIIEQLFFLPVLQSLIASTGLAGLGAVAAGASAVGAAWGAAATAATIATLGAAAGTAGLAFSAIGSGAALTAALSAPRLQEGGLVLPRPGGVPAVLAEAGQPELVIPLEKLGAFGQTTVQVSLEGAQVILGGEGAEESLSALGDEFAFRMRTLRPSRSRGALI